MSDQEENKHPGTIFDEVYKNYERKEPSQKDLHSSISKSELEKKISSGINSSFYSNFKRFKLTLGSLSKKINENFSNTYNSLKNYRPTLLSLHLPKLKKKEDLDISFDEEELKTQPKQSLIDKINKYSSEKKAKTKNFTTDYFNDIKIKKPLIILGVASLIAIAGYRHWNSWDSNKIDEVINMNQIITAAPKSAELLYTKDIINSESNLENVLWDSNLNLTNSNSNQPNSYTNLLNSLSIKRIILGTDSLDGSQKYSDRLKKLLKTNREELASYVSSNNKDNMDVSLSLTLTNQDLNSLFDDARLESLSVKLEELLWDKEKIRIYETEPKFERKVKDLDFLKRFNFETGPDFSQMRQLTSYPLLFSLYNTLDKPIGLFSSADDMQDYFTKQIKNPEYLKSFLPELEKSLFSSQAFNFIDILDSYNNSVQETQKINSFTLTTDLYSDKPDQLAKLNNYLLLNLLSSVKEYAKEKRLEFSYVLPRNPSRNLAYENFNETLELRKEEKDDTSNHGLIYFGIDFEAEKIDSKSFYEHAKDLVGNVIISPVNLPEEEIEKQTNRIFKSIFPFTKYTQTSNLNFMVNLPENNSNLNKIKEVVENVANHFDNNIGGYVIYKR